MQQTLITDASPPAVLRTIYDPNGAKELSTGNFFNKSIASPRLLTVHQALLLSSAVALRLFVYCNVITTPIHEHLIEWI